MNTYTIAPLVAVLAYIPLLVVLAFSRPWQKRSTLFIHFIIAAMLWSTVDILLRSDYFPDNKYLLAQLIIVVYFFMMVQLNLFTSSFFPKGQGRWLPFAYGSLVVVVVLVALGIVPEGIGGANDFTFINYGKWIFLIAIPLLVMVFRNGYVFFKMLKKLDQPVLYNQIVTLIVSIAVLTIFTAATVLPIGNSFPIPHYGNLIVAFILSFAVIRHQLIDIKLVMRRSTAGIILGVGAIAIYWLLLIVTQKIFNFKLDVFASIVSSILAGSLGIITFFLRGRIFNIVDRALQGRSYRSQQKLHEFTNKIHNVFSLKEQGGELLTLLVQALNIDQACLLFPEADTGDWQTQFCESIDEDNRLANFRLRSNNPIVKYLEKEKKYLSKENLATLPSFLSLWPQEKEEIDSKNISMFIPLISRERLIAILVLGKKESGRFSLEEISIIENVTSRVAVSMEKEYLREQVREREEELSVINNSSVILSSSLDIQVSFGSFIEELKKVVNVNWATIVLIDEDEFVCVALSSTEISAYQIGDRVPMERTGTAWVVSQKKPFIETDLAAERYFTTSENFYKNGIRSMAYLPLIAKGKIIGSFILGSKTPHAFSQRHIRLLEQLASQIAMPLENSQLYARAEKKARIDELTGLYNRRSLDEMIDSEISRHSRYGGAFSLAILDLDSFKAYNDTYGHLAGDGLLKTVASNIKAAIRTADYAFRYGGDEFAVLLPQTSIDAALLVLERVREKIVEGVDTSKINITASIGVACWPDDGISHTDIIASADVTLYRAKRNGRNQTLCTSGPRAGLTLDGIAGKSDNSVDNKLSVVVDALADMVDSRSYYTTKHSKKVTGYALALAKALELDKEETLKIETCALLHDVGKIAISADLLSKHGEPTEREWGIIKTHPKLGAGMIKQIPQLAHCVEPVLHHHEKYDGTGYPDGQKGEDIPIISRILAIANAFAVMTSDRSYSETITHENALEELKKSAGIDFDPNLVERFVAIFEIKANNHKKEARRKSGLGPSSLA
jgi:diguanylate cyclase (GGDEF)-like protein/putative nucleotidyltransferase with HDIG domain